MKSFIMNLLNNKTKNVLGGGMREVPGVAGLPVLVMVLRDNDIFFKITFTVVTTVYFKFKWC